MTSSRPRFLRPGAAGLLPLLGLVMACGGAPSGGASATAGGTDQSGPVAASDGGAASDAGTTSGAGVLPGGGTGTVTSGTGTSDGGTSATDGGTSTTDGGTVAAAANVMPVTVDGSQCAAGSYVNKPCVSVKVCTPGTATCQTIDDVLLDTGSYGLRIFSQVLTIALPAVAAGSGTLAECVQYGGGTSDWGKIATASVELGGEPAVLTPIQIIDATFGVVPASCPGLETDPHSAGLNGVLGVGVFAEDCGSPCAASARNGMYYSCTTSGCTGVAVPLASQVQNPVALLPADNNGVIVQLPGVPASGAPSVAGQLLLGIGTSHNNTPPGALTTYALDSFGEFTTTFDGTTYSSFLDTGSNGLFFGLPSTVSIPACATPNTAWYCPPATLSFQAENTDATGSKSGTVDFQIGNLAQLLASSNAVFPDIGGPVPTSSGFDWGLPFFLGRPVYVGFAGRSSTLGSGAYWAF